MHVLQLSLIRSTETASVRRPKGGGAEPARSPLSPPLAAAGMVGEGTLSSG